MDNLAEWPAILLAVAALITALARAFVTVTSDPDHQVPADE